MCEIKSSLDLHNEALFPEKEKKKLELPNTEEAEARVSTRSKLTWVT